MRRSVYETSVSINGAITSVKRGPLAYARWRTDLPSPVTLPYRTLHLRRKDSYQEVFHEKILYRNNISIHLGAEIVASRRPREPRRQELAHEEPGQVTWPQVHAHTAPCGAVRVGNM